MEVLATRTLGTPPASVLRDMLERSVKQIKMNVPLARATMGPCARMKLMVTLASASQDIKAGTAKWRWMSVPQSPARMKLHASMRLVDTYASAPVIILVSVHTSVPDNVVNLPIL